jgi:MoaA/NifB/PqqE/SkfB family radical SAM enzyme
MNKKSPEPNVFVCDACNQRCVFCSAEGEDRRMSEREKLAVLRIPFGTVSLEGGEPLLNRRLELLAAAARRAGTKNVMLFTNGLLLTEERLRSLLAAGVNGFNFNLPSHRAATHDALTGVRGQLPRKLAKIKRAIALSPPGSVVLTFVVTAGNFREMPAYVRFVARELKGVFYVSFNFIKIKGRVKKNPGLVPRISAAAVSLRAALRAARKAGLRVITDGFPLCLLKGFELTSIDLQKALRASTLYSGEKAKGEPCESCSVSSLCWGPRADYLRLRGAGEFRPLKTDPVVFLKSLAAPRPAARRLNGRGRR